MESWISGHEVGSYDYILTACITHIYDVKPIVTPSCLYCIYRYAAFMFELDSHSPKCGIQYRKAELYTENPTYKFIIHVTTGTGLPLRTTVLLAG